MDFLCVFKNTDLSNICASIVFKAKQKKNMKKKLLMVFITKLKNALFGWSTDFLYLIFSVLAFKTLYTQILFWSVFFKKFKKPLLTTKNGQNDVSVRFQKYWPKENLCVYCFQSWI